MASLTKPLAISGIIAASLGIAVIIAFETDRLNSGVVEASDVNTTPIQTLDIAETPAAAVKPTPEPEPVVVAEKPEAKTEGPAFDTFRVEGDGLFVIAGKAEAGQTVDVMLAGQAVERVVADNNGSFGAVLVLDPSEDARRLVLLADPDGDAIASSESFLVEPFAVVPSISEAPAEPVVLGAVSTESADEVRASIDVAVPSAPELSGEDSSAPSSRIDPATVLVADDDGVRVVASQRNIAPELTSNIALDTITYDPAGEVAIAGRASGEGFVQVYIDNRPITTSRIADTGEWRTDLPEVDTGIYTLRVDEVDAEGTVVSRIETPFKREDSDTVAAVLAEDTAEEGFDVAVRTVQPGATLWAIAREELGAGVLYVAVYEANKDLIRDPDLIYPGQVFRVPEVAE